MNALGHQLSPVGQAAHSRVIGVNDGYASMSGPAIRDLARQNLEMWRQTTNKPILSIGGVESSEEVYYRQNELGAFITGSTQNYVRAADPRRVAQRLAQEYVDCL